jgi:hypothetical protein
MLTVRAPNMTTDNKSRGLIRPALKTWLRFGGVGGTQGHRLLPFMGKVGEP